MAEKLEEYEFTTRGRVAKYPWKEWLDGGIYRLTKGTDFDVALSTMQSAAQAMAKSKGMKARTKAEDSETLVIQAYDPEEAGEVVVDGQTGNPKKNVRPAAAREAAKKTREAKKAAEAKEAEESRPARPNRPRRNEVTEPPIEE